jgi:hypothetical protein
MTRSKREREVRDGSKLENRWLRFIRIHWELDRSNLRQPGGAPFGSDVWSIERDSKKLMESVPPDDPLFAKLAALARLPDGPIERLQQSIFYELKREWQWHLQPSTQTSPAARRHARVQLNRLAKLSSDLCSALHDLNDPALRFLGEASLYLYVTRSNDEPPPPPPRGGYDFDQYQKMTTALAERSSRALHLARPKPSLNRVGRPARGGLSDPVGPGSFTQFVIRLWWDITAAGGRLTLDKNNRPHPGTLADALELMRPYLPPGFIPNVLPLSTLERIRRRAAEWAHMDAAGLLCDVATKKSLDHKLLTLD